MNLRIVIRKLASIVIDEADRNPDFARRVESVLRSYQPDDGLQSAPDTRESRSPTGGIRRPGRRRRPAAIDPIQLATRSEHELREALATLTLDQLKDIVAEYGMDRDKLVMKWKKNDRVVEKIVEISISRAHKGDAFRS